MALEKQIVVDKIEVVEVGVRFKFVLPHESLKMAMSSLSLTIATQSHPVRTIPTSATK
jgi:hypothetical protein